MKTNKNIDKKVALTLIALLVMCFSNILPSMVEIITYYVIIVAASVYITGRLFIWEREEE